MNKQIIKLNLGCGSSIFEGWINVDYAFGARLIKFPFFSILNKKLKLFNLDWNKEIYIHNLKKKFPWPSSSVDIIYSSHILEHFSKEDGREFLNECVRVLKVNGLIRIVVPSLEYHVNEYLESRVKADDFIENLGVLHIKSKSGFKNIFSTFLQYPHKCMYDNKRLLEILNKFGVNAKIKLAFDSDINDIDIIESDYRTKNAIIIEGYKQ